MKAKGDSSVAVATSKFLFGMCDCTVYSSVRFAHVWIRACAIARLSGRGLLLHHSILFYKLCVVSIEQYSVLLHAYSIADESWVVLTHMYLQNTLSNGLLASTNEFGSQFLLLYQDLNLIESSQHYFSFH